MLLGRRNEKGKLHRSFVALPSVDGVSFLVVFGRPKHAGTTFSSEVGSSQSQPVSEHGGFIFVVCCIFLLNRRSTEPAAFVQRTNPSQTSQGDLHLRNPPIYWDWATPTTQTRFNLLPRRIFFCNVFTPIFRLISFFSNGNVNRSVRFV